MSRSSRRIRLPGGAAGLWAEVDAWAEDAVDPIAVRARWSARAVPARGRLRHIDVTGEATEARAALGTALAAPPPGLLAVLSGEPGATLPLAIDGQGARALVLAPDGAALQAALHAWGATLPEGWGLPGTPARAAVRAALGGRLLAWLAALDA